MTTPDHIRAHRHCSRHREELLASARCGCFYCEAVFRPAEINEWVDEWGGVGQTAMCPHCGIDSVIGSESGYPITTEFLATMKTHWF
jgi:hypothetical protein